MQSVLFRHKFIAFLVQHPQPSVLWRTSLLRRLLQLSVPLLELVCASLTYCMLRLRLSGLVPCNAHSHVPQPRDQGVVARFRCRHSFPRGQRHFFDVLGGRLVPVAMRLQA